MKNLLILIISASALISCGNTEEKHYSLEERIRMSEIKDSLRSDIEHGIVEKNTKDTSGLSSSPVLVTKYSLVKEEYSNRKSIQLDYKNVSDKTISAIRFEWYGENAFSEPADMGSSFLPGEGSGFTDDALKPSRSDNGIWKIYSSDAHKIIYARAYEVAFSDGTKWKLHN